VKLSPTPTLEEDEQYEDRRHNYEAKCHARQRNRGKDLIWHTRMQREKYNLNQRAQQLDIHEAHLRRRERRCDHRDAEIHVARIQEGRVDQSRSKDVVCIVYLRKSMLGLVRTLLG
jgi:hypothetical protein